jgi:hypothetical protein
MLLLALACTPPPCPEGFEAREDGNCYPSPAQPDSPAGDSEAPDSDDSEPPDSDPWVVDLELGDPLEISEGLSYPGWEFLDGAILEDGRLLAVGQGGWMLADPATGGRTSSGDIDRVYRLALDGDLAYAASRTGRVTQLKLGSGNPEQGAREKVSEGYHEDIAADDGRVLVGAQEEGALLLDEQLRRVATVPASFAGGVALLGDVGLMTDDDELVLLDMSSSTPVELERAALRGRGRDIAFDGANVAVAMGSEGVDVFELSDGALVYSGPLDMPGSAFSVTLDGDMLYVAAWEVIVAAWLGGDRPVVVGHEEPHHSAWAVAARDGVLAVMDWGTLTPMTLNEGVAGAEVHPPDQVWVPPESTDPFSVPLTNYGAFELELELDGGGSVDVSPPSLTLAPGEQGVFTLTPSSPWKGQRDLQLSTNDPDERNAQLKLRETEGSIGAVHPEMMLEGFVPPSASTEVYDLADYRGKPVFIAYFTTW